MRLRNKILLTIGSIILIIVLIIMNLRTYSPYYAMHMPKPEGAHPEVYFALLNLKDIHKPESDNFKYETPDFNRYRNSIGVYTDGEWQCGIIMNEKDNPGTHSFIQKDANYVLYMDQNFNVIQVIDCTEDWEEITLSNEKKEALRRELLEDLQPVFDAQYRPLFSLQWLFNWIYGDFVNG